MRPIKIMLLFAGLILLVGCEKASPDSLQGRWEPIYASGVHENAVYSYSFDGPVDEHGQILATMVGKINPDIEYEPSTMLITGIRFFRNHGEDVFTTFFKDSPHNEIGKPLKYRVKSGKLYRELPMGAFINCSQSKAGNSTVNCLWVHSSTVLPMFSKKVLGNLTKALPFHSWAMGR